MKKIINGRKYDTGTAYEIGYACNKAGRSSYSFWEETLYRKKTGEFFLHGSGGPASRYAEACGDNTRTDGSKIIPLTENEAKKWAEEYLDVETYESIFGPVNE